MKSIFTALAPNVESDDAVLALKLLFAPWKWKRGSATAELADTLKKRLDVPFVELFETGRTGLEATIRCLGLGRDDEVLLQAFTCVAVPNAVIWGGAKPVYVDCTSEDYTMSVDDLVSKITPRSKAIIVQHTFGTIANIDGILKIAREHHLIVIEDCAHGLQSLQGDVSFFSFGRDKSLSSVFGGAVATRDQVLAQKLTTLRGALPQANYFWIKRQLFYPVFMHAVRQTFDIGIGRVLLALVKLLHITTKPVYASEKQGRKPGFLGKQMPNCLAKLALHQLGKLDRFDAHRREIVAIYAGSFEGSGVLRYTLRDAQAAKIREQAARMRIYLGDWYTTAIAPAGVSYQAIGYEPASCPIAEQIAGEVVNLPTDIHISAQDAQRILSCIHSSNQ